MAGRPGLPRWVALLAFFSLIAPALPYANSPAPRFFLRLSLRGGDDSAQDSAQFSLLHPPPEPPPESAPAKGPAQVERGPPILRDDVPNRPSVRERDEWLWLFSSMQTYKPLFPRAWVRDSLAEEGAECMDANTLTFVAFLLDVYAARIIDYSTDWALLRLQGEEEDKADADPKYHRRDPSKYMESMDFTLVKEDVLQALNEIRPGDDIPHLDIASAMIGGDPGLPSSDSSSDSESSSGIEEDGELRDGKVENEAMREMVNEPSDDSADSKEESESESGAMSKSSGNEDDEPMPESSEEPERPKRARVPTGDEDNVMDSENESESADFDRYMQQELASELPGSDPEGQEEGYYAVTGLVSDPIDELELMSPWGTELQDESTAAEYFSGYPGYPGAQVGYGGMPGGGRDDANQANQGSFQAGRPVPSDSGYPPAPPPGGGGGYYSSGGSHSADAAYQRERERAMGQAQYAQYPTQPQQYPHGSATYQSRAPYPPPHAGQGQPGGVPPNIPHATYPTQPGGASPPYQTASYQHAGQGSTAPGLPNEDAAAGYARGPGGGAMAAPGQYQQARYGPAAGAPQGAQGQGGQGQGGAPPGQYQQARYPPPVGYQGPPAGYQGGGYAPGVGAPPAGVGAPPTPGGPYGYGPGAGGPRG